MLLFLNWLVTDQCNAWLHVRKFCLWVCIEINFDCYDFIKPFFLGWSEGFAAADCQLSSTNGWKVKRAWYWAFAYHTSLVSDSICQCCTHQGIKIDWHERPVAHTQQKLTRVPPPPALPPGICNLLFPESDQRASSPQHTATKLIFLLGALEYRITGYKKLDWLNN